MEIGKLHVILAHFPVALALSVALADVLLVVTREDFFRICGMYDLVLAVIAIIPTAYMGDQVPDSEQSQLCPGCLSIAHIYRDLVVTSLVRNRPFRRNADALEELFVENILVVPNVRDITGLCFRAA
jgi:hypothetical protein